MACKETHNGSFVLPLLLRSALEKRGGKGESLVVTSRLELTSPLHFLLLLLLTCEERSPFSLARRGEKKNCFRFGLRQLVVTLLKSRGGGGGFFA